MIINRKLKSLDNKTGQKIIAELNNIIDNHEHYKKCYFWTPCGNAASRRREEFDRKLIFNLDGKKYVIEQSLTISCKNYYFSTEIYVDSVKKNITAIKKLMLLCFTL